MIVRRHACGALLFEYSHGHAMAVSPGTAPVNQGEVSTLIFQLLASPKCHGGGSTLNYQPTTDL